MIHHIAVPRLGDDLFATGESDTRVAVWSLQSRTRITNLSTVLDFGGYRLGLVDGGRPIVVAGSWEKGVAAYEASTGKRLWLRRDLRHTQQVRDLSNGNFRAVGIGVDEMPYYILDAETGADSSAFANVVEAYGSPFGPQYLLVGADKTVHLSSELRMPSIWQKPLVSFAILHAAFSPTQVAYTESRGSLYCFDFYGSEVWSLRPEPDHHIMRVAWDASLQRWLATKWNFQHGGPVSLIAIKDGKSRVLASVGDRWLMEFSPSGRNVITANGEVFLTDSGKSIWQLRDP